MKIEQAPRKYISREILSASAPLDLVEQFNLARGSETKSSYLLKLIQVGLNHPDEVEMTQGANPTGKHTND